MFQPLILPLKQNRRCHIEADFAEETATEYRPHVYHYEAVDIIILEGIYLLKRAYRHHFDLTFWTACSFETALERALRRAQEGLPPAETIRAYETIYFPAQRIHCERDHPQVAADFIIANDPRLDRANPYSLTETG
jgi:uridine kinase